MTDLLSVPFTTVPVTSGARKVPSGPVKLTVAATSFEFPSSQTCA